MKPKRNPDIKWRLEEGLYEVAKEKEKKGEAFEDIGVLTLTASGAIHQLNLVGAEIWLRINGINRVDKVVEEISALFEVEAGKTREDIEAFLDSIKKRGWITIE